MLGNQEIIRANQSSTHVKQWVTHEVGFYHCPMQVIILDWNPIQSKMITCIGQW